MLNNSKYYLEEQRALLKRIQSGVERNEQEVAEYEALIERAKQEGMDRFDRDKLGKKQKRAAKGA